MGYCTQSTITLVGDAHISKENVKASPEWKDDKERIIRCEQVTAYVNEESPYCVEINVSRRNDGQEDEGATEIAWFTFTAFELRLMLATLEAFSAQAKREDGGDE